MNTSLICASQIDHFTFILCLAQFLGSGTEKSVKRRPKNGHAQHLVRQKQNNIYSIHRVPNEHEHGLHVLLTSCKLVRISLGECQDGNDWSWKGPQKCQNNYKDHRGGCNLTRRTCDVVDKGWSGKTTAEVVGSTGTEPAHDFVAERLGLAPETRLVTDTVLTYLASL